LSGWLYLVAVAIYLVFFGLFVRFFIWKRHAEQTYWRRRPALDLEVLNREASRRGKELPFISVLIPARNEADVIGRTIDHMCRLIYPPSRYEVVVITDEKERLARDEMRERAICAALASLKGETDGAQGRMLVLALLARLAQEHWQPGTRLGRALGWQPAVRLDPREERGLVREMAWTILQHRGAARPGQLMFLVRRAFNGSGPEVARRAYPLYLAATLPVVLAYLHLTRQAVRPVWLRLSHTVLPLEGATSPDVVLSLAAGVARGLVRQLVACRRSGSLAAVLEDVFPECFPTTQDVVQVRVAALAGREVPRVRQVEVPYDFDGSLGAGARDAWFPPPKAGR